MPDETERRQGYYLISGKNEPSVSAVTKMIGNRDFLTEWAAGCGGKGVVHALRGFRSDALAERLTTSASLEWAKETGIMGYTAELERTAAFGQLQHSFMEALAQGEPCIDLGLEKAAKIAFKTLEEFILDIGFDWICIEKVIFSTKYKFGGRLDAVVNLTEEHCKRLQPYLKRSSDPVEPGLTVLDLKTGTFSRDEFALRTSAYAQAYFEDTGDRPTQSIIIHIYRERPEKCSCYFYNKKSLARGWKGFRIARQAWDYYSPLWYRAQGKKPKKKKGKANVQKTK